MNEAAPTATVLVAGAPFRRTSEPPTPKRGGPRTVQVTNLLPSDWPSTEMGTLMQVLGERVAAIHPAPGQGEAETSLPRSRTVQPSPDIAHIDISIPATTSVRTERLENEFVPWLAPVALEVGSLPSWLEVLPRLSGSPVQLATAFAFVEAWLRQQPDGLPVAALIAALSRTGGVTWGLDAPGVLTGGEDEQPPRADSQVHLPEFRPATWPRLARLPGHLIVVDGREAATGQTVRSIDAALATTSDVRVLAMSSTSPSSSAVDRVYSEDDRVRVIKSQREIEPSIAPHLLVLAAGTVLENDTMSLLAALHRERHAAAILMSHPGDDRAVCATSVLTGAIWWNDVAAHSGSAMDLLRPDAIASALEARYLVWYSEARAAGVSRPDATPLIADLLDGTSAPPKRLLAELDRLQAAQRRDRRDAQRARNELASLRSDPATRLSQGLRRRARRWLRR